MEVSFDLIDLFRILLLCLLVICAICAVCSRKLLTTVVVYMSYSTVMAVIWMLLRSPDLAITEAAVGAGVSTILFFLCLRKIGSIGSGSKGKGDETTDKPSSEPEGDVRQ